MWSFERTRSRIVIIAAILLLTFAASCTGFFVNQPNSITVTTGANGGGSSSFTVAQGSTVQLFATATYSSGNKDVTNSAVWQSSTPCATVNLGSVKGLGSSSGVTITATLSGVGGSATGTVTGSGQGLLISSVPSGPTFTNLTSATFSATYNGSDVTSSTTWTSSSNIATFQNNVATFSGTGPATITGSYVNGSTCAGASVNITVQ
jgi:hypothetical protein